MLKITQKLSRKIFSLFNYQLKQFLWFLNISEVKNLTADHFLSIYENNFNLII